LTATIGGWTGAHSYTYAWQSVTGTTGPWVPIAPPQIGKTYTVVAGDVGKSFKVIVTGVNPIGSTPATSTNTLVAAAT
jgi:hypothetical protein